MQEDLLQQLVKMVGKNNEIMQDVLLKVDNLDVKVSRLDAKVNDLDAKVDHLTADITDLKGQVSRLENRFDKLEDHMLALDAKVRVVTRYVGELNIEVDVLKESKQ
ncbi:hypothetical protein PP175_14270 [Aneurinibacillus sp. Ricciae_BoGa-3]|uniref:hypothetical protein n=1 Tax=Aneurinibacillus sp. Ricciae_BoGa-3 TaxID=3022697 RepID=UPI0023423099|nr:hypothetical protein [Aneurinibacillus sp. Ricciae_BoGa-3]WCK52599.1 hypothetical protein PP175_14270 [Aneurinibacillus sp. Ricciae_BoGa-3]